MTMHLLSPLSYSFLCPPSFIYLNFLVQTDRPWYSLQFILSSWQLRHSFLLIRLALSLTLSLIHTVTLSDSLSLTQNNSLSRSLSPWLTLFSPMSLIYSLSLSPTLSVTLSYLLSSVDQVEGRNGGHTKGSAVLDGEVLSIISAVEVLT